MARGRKSDAEEAARSGREGLAATLGTARVYLSLVRERVDAALRMDDPRVLYMACGDVDQADRLIVNVQKQIIGEGEQ